MKASSKRGTALLILFLVVVWGVTWPLTKIALLHTPPLLFSGLRTLGGGLVLLLLALPKVKQLQFKKTWPVYLISAFFNIICFYGFQTVGLQYAPAGLFSVIVYLQPVLIGILAWLWLGESMSALKMFGLLLGVAGVATVSAGGFSGHVSALGIFIALGTAVAWAIGTVYVKKVGSRVDSLWLVALQCLFGGIVLTAVGSSTESWSSIEWTGPFVVDFLFLTLFSISAAWMVFFHLVGTGEASKVASFTFFVPLISIFTSSILLGEALTIDLLFGLVLIIISILLVNRKAKRLQPGEQGI